MDKKIKHLLKYLELSLEKANNDSLENEKQKQFPAAIKNLGRVEAFLDVETKFKEIFEV